MWTRTPASSETRTSCFRGKGESAPPKRLKFPALKIFQSSAETARFFRWMCSPRDLPRLRRIPIYPTGFFPPPGQVHPTAAGCISGYNRNYNRPYDNRFYLDYGRPPNLRPNDSTAGEFRVLDTHSWRKIGTIKTQMPFWSAVTSTDGKVLYAMAPQKHSILIIDTVKMHQIAIFKVGGTPALALVAP